MFRTGTISTNGANMRANNISNEIRKLIHDNITDPNVSRRRNQNPFVYTHQPNTSQLPTIQIQEIDSTYNTLSIGNYTQFKRVRLQLDFRVRVNAEYDYDSDGELQTASDGLNYLISEVVDLILSKEEYLKDQLGEDFKGILPDLESNIRNLETDAIEKSIDMVAIIQK